MKKHWFYLKYVIRHKWFVFVACRKCGVGLWQALIHDWHKFLPGEWFAYADFFYGDWKKLKDSEPDDFKYWTIQGQKEAAFRRAWNSHQKRGRHHWQYWLLTNDSDSPKHISLQMPDKYMREMVADWWGAGRAITGNWDALSWYNKNRNEILLSERTREQAEALLKEGSYSFSTPENIAKRIRILGC